MPFSDGPWENPESGMEADDFCAVCLIDENEGDGPKIKAKCKLPIRSERSGAINRNAVHAAAAALAGARGGVNASAASKRKAARRLVTLYGEMGEDVPESVAKLAR